MHGIVVQYSYDGDENAWRQTIDRFLADIAADDALAGKFHYLVTVGKDGTSRTHMGQWAEPAIVETLQSREFFKAFAAALKGLAGDTLQATPMNVYKSTG